MHTANFTGPNSFKASFKCAIHRGYTIACMLVEKTLTEYIYQHSKIIQGPRSISQRTALPVLSNFSLHTFYFQCGTLRQSLLNWKVSRKSPKINKLALELQPNINIYSTKCPSNGTISNLSQHTLTEYMSCACSTPLVYSTLHTPCLSDILLSI